MDYNTKWRTDDDIRGINISINDHCLIGDVETLYWLNRAREYKVSFYGSTNRATLVRLNANAPSHLFLPGLTDLENYQRGTKVIRCGANAFSQLRHCKIFSGKNKMRINFGEDLQENCNQTFSGNLIMKLITKN